MELQDPFRWPPRVWNPEFMIRDRDPLFFVSLHGSGYHLMALTRAYYSYTIVFFFIRTSNFGAEADRYYTFLLCEAENVLKMFLNLQGIIFQ